MIQLSYWAKHHPAKARVCIVFLHILLVSLAIYTGRNLKTMDINMPAYLPYVLFPLFISVCILYPSRPKTKTAYSRMKKYRLQKSLDFCSAAFSFILVCYIANSDNLSFIKMVTGSSIESTKLRETKPTAQEILASLSYRDKSTLTRTEKRILKNEFKKQLKVYVKAKLARDEDTAGKAALIALSIIAAVGLTYLLAILACNVACNGSEAAAALLLILGITAIVFLLIFVIKKIKNHKKPGIEETPVIKTEG